MDQNRNRRCRKVGASYHCPWTLCWKSCGRNSIQEEHRRLLTASHSGALASYLTSSSYLTKSSVVSVLRTLPRLSLLLVVWQSDNQAASVDSKSTALFASTPAARGTLPVWVKLQQVGNRPCVNITPVRDQDSALQPGTKCRHS